MNKNQNGFGHIELIIIIVVIAVIGLAGFKVLSSKKDKNQNYNHQTYAQSSSLPKLPLVIKNWPVKIAAYNSSTQLAGDVYLNKSVLLSTHFTLDQIPLSEAGRHKVDKTSGKEYVTPTIDFLTRPNAPLLSVSEGYVVSLDHQVENGHDDYEMHVTPEKNGTHLWMVIYDHLTKPSVKNGDAIKAGQQIGETGPIGGGYDYSFIELQVNYNTDADHKGTAPNEGRCPGSSIGPDRLKAMSDELSIITGQWETLRGDTSIYNEAAWVAPGCLSEKVQV